MKFARKNNDCNKFIISIKPSLHRLTCTLCQNIEDFDDMDLKNARELAHNSGWRKGTDSDNEIQCCCPECVEANEVFERDNKHFTEMNSYE